MRQNRISREKNRKGEESTDKEKVKGTVGDEMKSISGVLKKTGKNPYDDENSDFMAKGNPTAPVSLQNSQKNTSQPSKEQIQKLQPTQKAEQPAPKVVEKPANQKENFPSHPQTNSNPDKDTKNPPQETNKPAEVQKK